MAYETRATPADLEIRGDGRTVVGIAVPYDSPTQVRAVGGSYTELFRRGAFARTIQQATSKVKFLALHDSLSRLPLGRATLLREDTAGLYGEFHVSKTRDGDEALQLVADGALDGLSVGFEPVRENVTKAGVVERVEVRLREVSLVVWPSYTDALVTAVRGDVVSIAELAARLERFR